MNIERDLHKKTFVRREEQLSHMEYNKEYQFYSSIAMGDMENVRNYLMDTESSDIYNSEEYGILSGNALQNARYHFVVAVALITRICAEYGMNREKAYNLSDLFIQKMDSLQTIQEISILHNEMIIDFTRRMKNERKESAYSVHVVRAVEYIYIHLHDNIKTSQIAEALNISRSYLSQLFHDEMGIQLHEYIVMEKINSAKHLLTSTGMGYSEIAEYYGFSSQSHFIGCFKKITGYTPSDYRRTFYHKSEIDV